MQIICPLQESSGTKFVLIDVDDVRETVETSNGALFHELKNIPQITRL